MYVPFALLAAVKIWARRRSRLPGNPNGWCICRSRFLPRRTGFARVKGNACWAHRTVGCRRPTRGPMRWRTCRRRPNWSPTSRTTDLCGGRPGGRTGSEELVLVLDLVLVLVWAKDEGLSIEMNDLEMKIRNEDYQLEMKIRNEE